MGCDGFQFAYIMSGTAVVGEHCLLMREYEIKLMGPSGRVAEVYVMAAPSDDCALERARILTQLHPEFASAEVVEDRRVLDADIRGFSYIH
jgi:hypothetical protein